MKQHKTRRQEYADETYQVLIGTAHTLFVSQGFNKTSVDQVVTTARLTKGALYHHFKNKEALFAACYEQQVKQVADKLGQITLESNCAWESTLQRCYAFLEIGKKHRSQAIPLQEAMTVLGWSQWREIDMKYTMGLVRESVELLMNNGVFKQRSLDLVSEIIYGLMVETSMSIVRAKDKRKALQESVDIVKGILESMKA